MRGERRAHRSSIGVRFSRANEDLRAALEVAHLAVAVAERAHAPQDTLARLREMLEEITGTSSSPSPSRARPNRA